MTEASDSIFNDISDPWNGFSDYPRQILCHRRAKGRPAWIGAEHPDYARYLHFLVRRTGAQRLLELGFQSGGSAYGLATGLEKGGLLIGIDNEDSENAKDAMADFLELFPHLPVQPLVGNSHELLPTLTGPFDIIHFDHYKECYLPDLKWMLASGFFHKNTIAVFHDTTTIVPEPVKEAIQQTFLNQIPLDVVEGAWVCWGLRET